MSTEYKQQQVQRLWDIPKIFKGRISVEENLNYILGFISFKSISAKQYLYANYLLPDESVKEYTYVTDAAMIKEEPLAKLDTYINCLII